MVRAQSKSHQLVKKMALRPSGGQGIRTLNPLRGTCTPNRPLAIRIPSEDTHVSGFDRVWKGEAKARNHFLGSPEHEFGSLLPQ